MIFRVLLIAFALLYSSALARTPDATLFWEFSSGNWAGGAYKDADGSFSHCYAAATYTSGITMAMGITADYDLQLVLGHTGWALPVGDRYNVGLLVDDRHLGQFPAVVTGNSMLTIHVGKRDDVLTRLRRGYELRVTAERDSFYFSLTGTNQALRQVKECVDLAVALSPSKRNPFASGNSGSNPFTPWASATS